MSLAATLNSAFAVWFFLMSAATYGSWKPRLFTADLPRLPVPSLKGEVASESGCRILELGRKFRQHPPTCEELETYDEAVSDLYGLTPPNALL